MASIIGQCPDCCDCIQPTLLVYTASASKTKYGWINNDWPANYKFYLQFAASGSLVATYSPSGSSTTRTYSGGPLVYDPATNTTSGTITETFSGGSSTSSTASFALGNYPKAFAPQYPWPGADPCFGTTVTATTLSSVQGPPATGCGTGYTTASGDNTYAVSDEYTTTMLKVNTVSVIGTPSASSGSVASASLATNELTYSAKKGKYQFRFPVPRVGAGKCYKLKWIERFIPALTYSSGGSVTGGGTALSSIEVVRGGATYTQATAAAYLDGDAVGGIYPTLGGIGYATTPTVTISAPPTGGTQAHATAIISDGSVIDFTIDTPGSGYIEAPAVTLSFPTGATAPTITISTPGNGGTTATGSVSIDSTGTITGASLGVSGTRYLAEPSISITSPHGIGLGATFIVHLGTETAKTETWDGVVPGGYDVADSSTWPVSSENSIDVPASDGSWTVEHYSAACYGCA